MEKLWQAIRRLSVRGAPALGVAAGQILYTASEDLRLAATLLAPVMPQKTKIVLEVLGTLDSGTHWGELRPAAQLKSHEALFPRVDVDKKV